MLTPVSGVFLSSANGQVIEAKDVSGTIIVKHTNVTIRNCEASNIFIDSGASGAVVEYSTVLGGAGPVDPVDVGAVVAVEQLREGRGAGQVAVEAAVALLVLGGEVELRRERLRGRWRHARGEPEGTSTGEREAERDGQGGDGHGTEGANRSSVRGRGRQGGARQRVLLRGD